MKCCPYKALWFVGHRWHRVFLVARHLRNEQFQKNKQMDSKAKVQNAHQNTETQHKYIWVVAAVTSGARFLFGCDQILVTWLTWKGGTNPTQPIEISKATQNIYTSTYRSGPSWTGKSHSRCKTRPCRSSSSSRWARCSRSDTINLKGAMRLYTGLSNIP